MMLHTLLREEENGTEIRESNRCTVVHLVRKKKTTYHKFQHVFKKNNKSASAMRKWRRGEGKVEGGRRPHFVAVVGGGGG